MHAWFLSADHVREVALAPASDPVDRPIVYSPPNSPYDPRNMLAGATNVEGTFEPGFFDVGSFTESAGTTCQGHAQPQFQV